MEHSESSENLYDFIQIYLSQVRSALRAVAEGTNETYPLEMISITETLLQHVENQILEAVEATQDKLGEINIIYEPSEATCVRKIIRAAPADRIGDEKVVPASKAGNAEFLSINASDSDEIPSFRIVEPGSKEADLLQRVFQMMGEGGTNWDFLQQAIDLIWTK